jgi:hypothetical protein
MITKLKPKFYFQFSFSIHRHFSEAPCKLLTDNVNESTQVECIAMGYGAKGSDLSSASLIVRLLHLLCNIGVSGKFITCCHPMGSDSFHEMENNVVLQSIDVNQSLILRYYSIRLPLQCKCIAIQKRRIRK